MKKQMRRFGARTFAAKQKAMLAALVAVALLDFAVCMGSMRELSRETAGQMSRIAAMQIDEVYRQFSEISYDMRRLLMENQDMAELAVNGSEREQIYAKGKLLEKMVYSFRDREEYHPFFYFEQTEELLGASWIDLQDARESGIVGSIIQKIGRKGEAVWNLYQWEQFEQDGQYYMLKAYCYNDIWLLCYVPASVMTASLDEVYKGEGATAVLLGGGGEILSGEKEAGKLGIPKEKLAEGATLYRFPWQRIQIVTEKSRELDISIAVVMSGYGGFARIIVIQGIVLFMVLITLASFLILTLYTRKRIIVPVQRFIKGVQSYTERGEVELSNSDIQELEQVNEQFRGFVSQIKDLKMDIYEQKLKRQKLEMDNLKLQLKPHFFLNCLGAVVSLVQNGQGDEAVSMCQATIRYLRYLFCAGLEAVAVREAIVHLENYCSIMKLRYPGDVEMDLYVEERALGCQIPPLMIQTLVENSFKYAKTAERMLEVSVTVTIERLKEEECLCINVSDNGEGYREDYIELWQSGGELAQQSGGHIGIANLRARVRYAYGDKARVNFYNSPMGGAVTEIQIPLHLTGKEDEA